MSQVSDPLGEFMDAALAYFDSAENGLELAIRQMLWTRASKAYHAYMEWQLEERCRLAKAVAPEEDTPPPAEVS